MRIISTLKTITQVEMCRIKEMLERTPAPPLISAIERARQEWKSALTEMDNIDGDMTEYIIFKINAAEKRYMALLEQAKKEGVTAWPAMVEFLPNNGIYAGGGADEVENVPACTS